MSWVPRALISYLVYGIVRIYSVSTMKNNRGYSDIWSGQVLIESTPILILKWMIVAFA